MCSQINPQSGRAVEQANGTIKTRLNKVWEEIKLNWVKALPLVLMSMSGQGKAKTGLSSFEIRGGGP